MNETITMLCEWAETKVPKFIVVFVPFLGVFEHMPVIAGGTEIEGHFEWQGAN